MSVWACILALFYRRKHASDLAGCISTIDRQASACKHHPITSKVANRSLIRLGLSEAPAEPEPLDTRPEEWRDEDREWRQKASD